MNNAYCSVHNESNEQVVSSLLPSLSLLSSSVSSAYEKLEEGIAVLLGTALGAVAQTLDDSTPNDHVQGVVQELQNSQKCVDEAIKHLCFLHHDTQKQMQIKMGAFCHRVWKPP